MTTITMKTYDRTKAKKAQEDYCSRNHVPMFVPDNCWCCGRSIFDKISVEEAGSQMITGCPSCHRSFWD